MDYRNDLEASRLRISTLEAKLDECEASLKARDAELAERTSERDRLKKTGSSGPSRARLFGYLSISFVVGTIFGGSLGLHLSAHEPPNTAVGSVPESPEPVVAPIATAQGPAPFVAPQAAPVTTAAGRAEVPPPESIPSSAIVVGQAGQETPESKSIQTIINDARPSMRECYLKEADKNAEAQGSVNVTIDIEPSGKVSRVALTGFMPNSPAWWSKEFEACVNGVFRKLAFSPSKDASKTTASGNYLFTALDRRRQFE